MKKQYYIIGSGGFAKEVFFLADELLDKSNIFMGFIDYKPQVMTILARGKKVPVIDEDYFLSNILPSENIHLYHGIGDPKLLSKVSKQFENYIFPNLIHPNFIGDIESIQLEKGNIITAGSVFTVDIKIGSHNIFNLNSTIGHDTVIGDCNVFNPGVNISGNVKIGSENLFGTNSTVLQLIEIGDGNILGASSLANKNFNDDCIMVGVPAKNLKK